MIDFKQREYDGKWERVEFLRVPENDRYKDESGREIVLECRQWEVTGVFDYLGEFE